MDDWLRELLFQVISASNYAVIPPAVLVLLRWRHLSRGQRWFGKVLLLVALNQLVAKAITVLTPWSNLPLYNIYVMIEGLGLILLYRYRFPNQEISRWLPWIAGALALIIPINAFLIQGFELIPTYVRSLEAVALVFLSLFYFRQVFRERKVKYLDRSFWFWLNAGILIYFSPNLLLFMFTNELMTISDPLFLAVWSIHAGLNFIFYGFYSIAVLCRDPESSYSS